MCPPLWGDTWGYIWSKLQIQERWWVGCMSPKLKNDWLVPMFWCVCISKSDQSPSTKRCNKQDCRNQVVQFLTNPFLANFQNGHSPPLYFDGFADGTQGGNPCPPCIGGAWVNTWSKVSNPREVVGWLHVTRSAK